MQLHKPDTTRLGAGEVCGHDCFPLLLPAVISWGLGFMPVTALGPDRSSGQRECDSPFPWEPGIIGCPSEMA